jgi:hypothetical protein
MVFRARLCRGAFFGYPEGALTARPPPLQTDAASMKPRWIWIKQPGALVAAPLVLVLGAACPAEAAAQGFDPASTIGAYAAALNAHNLAAGLALFDQNGSATDKQGQHFEGRDGLTAFLLESGFGSPNARITTEHLRVLGNRALWTYTCSCATGTTEVRLVVNQDKITVFFMSRPSAASAAAASTTSLVGAPESGLPRWILEVGLGVAVLAVVLGLRRRRTPPPPSRPSQGIMLATLAQSRGLVHSRPDDPHAR